MRRTVGLLAGALGVWAFACSGEEAPTGPCSADTECPTGELCQAGACVQPARLDCSLEGDAVAQVQAEPATLDFGTVATESAVRSVVLSNSGNCSLVVANVAVEGGQNSRFVCSGCLERSFPATIYPGRSLRLGVTFNPGAPGPQRDRLIVTSNAAEQSSLPIDLIGESAGLPGLRVDPLALDFGFVPVGGTGERIVQAINSADGDANLEILSAEIDPPDSPAFTVAPMTLLPVQLGPARLDPSQRAAFTVVYRPPEQQAYTAELVITPRNADPIRVALQSNGSPPDISVSPLSIDLGTVRLGESAARTVAIQNRGQAELVGTTRLRVGTSSDLSLPQNSLRLAPGGLFELGIVYEPTRGGSTGDSIVIETNDPAQPSVSVQVTGSAVAAAEQVLSVEMTFDDDSSTALDKDLRDVDLILESPAGLVVRKASPMGAWGNAGAARWSGSPGDNPERVVLGRVMADGTYRVNLSYVEDCKTLPTALAASLLGIGADELVRALSEDDIEIDPTQLASAVERTCAQRGSTNATVVTMVDGAVVDTRDVRLSQKGDLVPALDLQVVNGRFSVVP